MELRGGSWIGWVVLCVMLGCERQPAPAPEAPPSANPQPAAPGGEATPAAAPPAGSGPPAGEPTLDPVADADVDLRLGTPEHLSTLAQPLLAAFRAAHPDVDVQLKLGPAERLVTGVRDGSLGLDLFLTSVDGDMDVLEKEGALAPGSRRALARNSIALLKMTATAFKSPPTLENLATHAEVKAIGMGDPTYVPAAIVTRQALEATGRWNALVDSGRLKFESSAGAALEKLEAGEVQLAFGYGSEAGAGQLISVVARVEGPGVPQTRYTLAIPSKAAHVEQAKAFVTFATGAGGQKIVADLGFLPAE